MKLLLLLWLAQPPGIETLSRNGAEALRARRYPEAVRLYRQALKADPSNPNWRLNLGLALSYDNQPAAALAEFQAYLKARSAPGPAYFLAGLALLKLSRHCDAIAPLQTAANWKPSAENLTELADAYQGCQRWPQAAGAYQRVYDQSPNPALMARIAHCWWMARRYDLAHAAFLKLPPALAGEPRLLYEHGDTLVRLEGPAAGLDLLSRAVAAEPSSLPSRAALGRALLDLDRPAEALPHLEAASSADPALLLPLSRALRALGRIADAERTEQTYRKQLSPMP